MRAAARLAAATDGTAAAALIRAHDLPREAVPTALLNDPAVWEALLERMPLTALVRSLAKLTAVGVLRPLGDQLPLVLSALGDADRIAKARLHPLAILLALRTYAQGSGDRGALRWEPVQAVVDALNAAFYTAFRTVEPTGKRLLLALDVSGRWRRARRRVVPDPARGVRGAGADDGGDRAPDPHRGVRGDDGAAAVVAVDAAGRRGARRVGPAVRRTDCAQPMLYALERGIPADAFVVYTDSETWAGPDPPGAGAAPVPGADRHRRQAGGGGPGVQRVQHRRPDDAGMLDVVGFDTARPPPSPTSSAASETPRRRCAAGAQPEAERRRPCVARAPTKTVPVSWRSRPAWIPTAAWRGPARRRRPRLAGLVQLPRRRPRRGDGRRQAEAAADLQLPDRGGAADAFRDAPLQVFGQHEAATLTQMRACMGVGKVVAGVVCADGHLGYAQPVGGVIAYEGQISISGVGFDIGCGNMAVRLDTPFAAIADRVPAILADVRRVVSFGVGRANAERVEHALLDDDEAWTASGMRAYREKAAAQLGTVGSGNHYVDLMEDEAGFVWIGVHFGSRGLGHTSATRYLKAAGGKDGMHVPPAVVDEGSELGAATSPPWSWPGATPMPGGSGWWSACAGSSAAR